MIDDSDESSAFIASLNYSRIVYRHLPTRMSIGDKRNLAVDLARGDIVAHFDDDEVYSPDYLTTMLERMHLDGTDFVKLGAFFIYSLVCHQFAYWDLMRKSGLHFCWSGGPVTLQDFSEGNKALSDNHLGFGFSYIYTKRLWAEQPFDPISFNEDGLFAKSAHLRGARIALPADDSGLCLHILHDRNTSKSFPQYIIPNVLVERHFPHFCEALDMVKMCEN